MNITAILPTSASGTAPANPAETGDGIFAALLGLLQNPAAGDPLTAGGDALAADVGTGENGSSLLAALQLLSQAPAGAAVPPPASGAQPVDGGGEIGHSGLQAAAGLAAPAANPTAGTPSAAATGDAGQQLPSPNQPSAAANAGATQAPPAANPATAVTPAPALAAAASGSGGAMPGTGQPEPAAGEALLRVRYDADVRNQAGGRQMRALAPTAEAPRSLLNTTTLAGTGMAFTAPGSGGGAPATATAAAIGQAAVALPLEQIAQPQPEPAGPAAAARMPAAGHAPLPDALLTEAAPGSGGTAAGGTQAALSPGARPMMPHPATEQVSAHLARAAAAGTDRILIQLHPAELGRVDVRLEIGADGRVAAVITADRQDTLDMLQRDARTLERTLQDSGLKTGGDSLSFGLRGEGRQNPSAEGERGHGQASSAAMALDELAIAPVAARTGPQAPGALDITV